MICPACSLDNVLEAEECFGCGKALFALTQGRVLADRYEIRKPLGQGGMGKVYEAWDRVLDDRVAVKVLRPQFAREPEMARRFLLEIRLARRITHPNVCRLHEYGECSGIRYLCMELVDGVNLKDVLRARPLSAAEACDIAIGSALGLEAVHAQGVIHRDFKTANIMVDTRGQVKVMDFGIAKEVGVDTTGVSLAGHVLGTPEYMSPEHVQGGPVDYRSDLYALGCVIFEIFAGRPLFQGTSPIDTLRRHLNEPAPLSNERGPLVPEPLVPVLARCLAKRPDDRYPGVTELLAELRLARESIAPSSEGDDSPLSDLLRVPPAPAPAVEPVAPQRTRSWPRAASPAKPSLLGARGLAAVAVPALIGVGALAWWRGAPSIEGPPLVTVATMPEPTTVATPPPSPPTSVASAAGTSVPSTLRAEPTRRAARTESTQSPPVTLAAAVIEPPVQPRDGPATPAPSVAPPPTTLAEAYGVLDLVVLPASEVSVDGKAYGIVSSQKIRLSPGKRALRIENPGFKPYDRVIDLPEGAALPVFIDLSQKGVPKTP